MARLLHCLAPAPDDTAPLILVSALTGMGGVGKTALALEAAHRALRRGWFPGGTLFVDLRGYDGNPVSADQAVLALLDALGVQGQDLPTTPARQHDAYRKYLAERQDPTLLILDNASDADQFLPLLPGTDQHRVLLTSRDRQDALAFRLVDLEALAPAESVALLTRALQDADERDDRPVSESDALGRLGLLCGHLPLALQICAAMLRRRRPRSIASLVVEIEKAKDATHVLDKGSPGTDLYGRPLALRPVLETSYRRLPADQARLLRLLALAPGEDIATEAVVALADLDEETAQCLLEDLAVTHLVASVRDTAVVRWRLHDLVRGFCAGLVAGEAELLKEGDAARERLLEFYLRWADAADDRLRWLPGMPQPERFPDRAQALAWLDTERAGLTAAVQWGREKSFADKAVGLSLCLGTYLQWRRYFDDWVTVAGTAQEAAHLAGDRQAEAMACDHLGGALHQLGRADEAIAPHTRAIELFQATEDPDNEAGACNNLGDALRGVGRVEEAIHMHTRAQELYQAAGNRHGEAITWNSLGLAFRKLHRLEEAVAAYSRSCDLFEAVGDHHREAMSWSHLGRALQQTGRVGEAVDAHSKALDVYQEVKDQYRAGMALEDLALAHEQTDRPALARTLYVRAADAYTQANAPTEASNAQSHADSLT
ncbi:tetratricopeptide repeat protein [Streptomyces sp. NPDC058755]|uniref:tetratricopeptide repeat protein n=1 Tax=Streptomyces sp. NPDC058755 TaxID=3346624 RepID=UPI00369F2222